MYTGSMQESVQPHCVKLNMYTVLCKNQFNLIEIIDGGRVNCLEGGRVNSVEGGRVNSLARGRVNSLEG